MMSLSFLACTAFEVNDNSTASLRSATNRTGLICLTALLLVSYHATLAAQTAAVRSWHMGAPIVTYFCGPRLTDATAAQMADGGWNLVWGDEHGLDIAQRHGLRLQIMNSLLTPATLDDPKARQDLDAFVARVSGHPAFYSYYIVDEPSATQFSSLGKLVAYLRERDPTHLAYIDLFPTYASNQQLGTAGGAVGAYTDYLKQYLQAVKPALISYDHYQFAIAGDTPDYFLNLALIRRASLDAGVPFLNVVQASTWAPQFRRVPGPDEMRYLVYTTLAYGAQGISYYVYRCANHLGGMANADGTPTRLYDALKTLNREFTVIAKELEPLRSIGVYHTGTIPPGAETLPNGSAFILDPVVPVRAFHAPDRLQGVMIGMFGWNQDSAAMATYALVVNLDYKAAVTVAVRGPGPLQVLDATTGNWSDVGASRAELHLVAGGGALLRVQ